MARALFFTLLALALCAPDVLAAPRRAATSAAIPIKRRIGRKDAKMPFKDVVAHDRARVAALKNRKNNKVGSHKRAGEIAVNVTNEAVTYIAEVAVGSPPTTFNLLIDTGSSNTWVGADTPFRTTSTSTCPGELMEVTYGSGFVFGEECTDQVSLGPGLTVTGQGIGTALLQQGFGDGIDGILGIGPTDLTDGTTSGGEEVPTITDVLFSQGVIPEPIVTVFFAPTTVEETANGVLTFGGVDTSLATSDVTFVPITGTAPASEFWGIDQTIAYGDTVIMPSTAGIVDTGTTLLLLPTDAFDAYTAATGATLDNVNTGLLQITPAQFAALQPLTFTIGGTDFVLTPNAQIWPRALNADIGGAAGDIFLIVNDIGTTSGEGLDFINGFVFLERFMSVFDTANSRVGFATTSNTNSEVN